MKLYIAGPMRGIPNFNFEAFDEVAEALRENGHEPISPADHDRELGFVTESEERGVETTDLFDIHTVMRWDLAQVAESDGIVLLPGWEHSTGAAHERYVAEACGHRIYHATQNANGTWSVGNVEVPPTIIGLSGYAQAGKDTAGAALVEHLDFERIAFADALRDILYALNPLVELHTFDPVDLREAVDRMGWEGLKAHDESEFYSARKYLQRLGTEAGRQVLGDDIWVRTAMAHVKPGGRYVFTDVRFPNEAAAIEAAGGQVWRITRAGSDPVNAHPSETALDGHTFHTVISNTGEDLAGFQSLIVANARVHL